MEKLDIQLEPLKVILIQISAFLPRLLIAVLVVLGGWLLAKLARITVTKTLRAMNFNVLTERSGMDGFLRQGGMAGDTTVLFGMLTYWLVILAALLIAVNGLGLTYIADLLSRMVWFIPNVFVALLVLAFGSYFARFVGETVASKTRLAEAGLLGRLAQSAIMVFVVMIAVDQIKVGGDIVRQSFLVILAGVVFALALAFGLAGRGWAAERIERWWPREEKAKDKSDVDGPRS